MAAEVEQKIPRDTYSGERKHQLREGFGIYQYENKFFKYEGEWRSGKKHGHGKLVMADGSYYEGEFEEGEIEGHGYRFWNSSGNKYSGEFHMGELHGQGVMTYSSGAIYEGEWFRNKRQGYGVYKTPESNVYQGYLHDHKRHGEGTQIYTNGDRYDGDWIQDKRQGHGELRCKDGTIYDGQWRSDLYNGQGTMVHASGMSYEGLWINGKPANMATKLVILCESPLEITQGVPFSIEIECQNEEGTKVEDKGRVIHIMIGVRYYPPKEPSSVSTSRENTTTGLFDMIEDVEETPVTTPFGYDIVSYPLTDQVPEELLLGMESRSNTMVSDSTVQEEESPEDIEGEVKEKTKEAEKQVKTETKPSESKSVEDETNAEPDDKELESVTSTEKPPETPLPPVVNDQRTEAGRVVFPTLLLPAAPPMYRPFMVLDEMESGKRSKSKLARKESDDRASSKARREKSVLGDERFARPGEYVLMVQDVTNPPFVGQKLETAFLQIRVLAAKKARRSVTKKDRGPRSK